MPAADRVLSHSNTADNNESIGLLYTAAAYNDSANQNITFFGPSTINHTK